MQILVVKLLADFHLTYDGAPVTTVNQPRLQSLLAYLLLHRNAQVPRHHLAFTFWPDTKESQARNNLRQMLHQLRHTLPDFERFFQVDSNSVSWLPNAPYQLDVAEFEQAAARVAELEPNSNRRAICQALQSAVSLYTGDLLPSCYEDWIEPERERLRSWYHRLLEQLIDLLEEQRDYATALDYAQRLLQADPLREETHLCLMRLYALSDNRAGALRAYNDCVAVLRRELQVEPSAEIQDTYKRLLQLNTLTTEQMAEHSLSSVSLPLIGRALEWDALRRAWYYAAGGHPHFALLTGEPGIGKTRLAEELLGWLRKQGIASARTRAYEAEGRLAYSPVTEWLRSRAVLPTLAQLDDVWRSEVARLLPELLSQYPNLAHPAPLTEHWQRQRFFEALARGILAVMSPLLLFIDDLQWCDPETLEWLHFLLRFDSHARMLIVGTARTQEMKDNDALGTLLRALQTANQIDVFSLGPLDASETRNLAASIADHELDETQALHLHRETEGNPLFVVETIRAGIGNASITEQPSVNALDRESLRLPPRVYTVIAGRLAQLSPTARKLAELGAAVGRAFTFDLLELAGQDDEEASVQALDELWQRRIVHELGANEFDFTHDKLRDVAYAEMSTPQRRLLHRRIAQALESLNVDSLDLVSGQIAAQYEQAGLLEQALPYYQRAGNVAANIYANEDAIALITRALELLPNLPPGAKRDAQELSLQLALAALYRVTKGWAAPEEEWVMNRAAALSNKVGSEQQRISMLLGLELMYSVQARYGKVESSTAEAEQLFKQQGRPSPPFSSINLACAKLVTGHPVEARDLLERVTSARHVERIVDVEESVGINYLVHGLSLYCHTLWCLGYSQAALEKARAAIDHAQKYSRPFNQATAITYQALLHEWCAPPGDFRTHAEQAYAFTQEHAVPYYHAWSAILLCFAQIEQRRDEGELARLRDAIRAFTEAGARIRLPVYYSLLARACLRLGRFDEATEAIDLAFAKSRQNHEHWWDAELHRLRGELWWAQGAASDQVEAVFRRSLEIARSQQTRSLELRAATCLARLWQEQGRRSEARNLLSPIYGWFTEGFDTPDLKEAGALLDQLES